MDNVLNLFVSELFRRYRGTRHLVPMLNPEKIRAILKYPIPKTIKEIKSLKNCFVNIEFDKVC